jgi:hypothetical protein
VTYDQADGYVLLFGGVNNVGTVTFDDTWTFLGGVWTPNLNSTPPPGRSNAYMTFDSLDGYVLLFGGNNVTSGVLQDTWAYLGGVWWDPLPAYTSPAPDIRAGGAMVYDSGDGYVLLFGGATNQVGYYPPSTWTYASGVWTNITSTLSTAPTYWLGMGMVDDAFDGYVLLYGGEIGGGVDNQTWSFANGAWTLLSPAAAPANDSYLGMAFDPVDNEVVLFDGWAGFSFVSGTWTY